MLDTQRAELASAFAPAHHAMIASGTGGVHAELVRCAAQGVRLFLLLPAGSAQLARIEAEREVVVVTSSWQVRGTARPLCAGTASPFGPVRAERWRVVEVAPAQAALVRGDGWEPADLIIVDEADADT